MEKSSNKTDVGVKVGQIGGPIVENGGQVSFVVTLRTAPDSDVIIPISTSDSGLATVAPAQLVFTPEDFESPHTVTISSVDDDIVDGNATPTVIFGATLSSDDDYADIALPALPFTILDDEVAAVLVSVASGPVTEGGAEAEVSVVLSARPQGPVQVGYSSSDDTEGEPDGQSVEFSEADWYLPQTITVAGVDDGTPDGNQTFALVFAPTLSSDPAWDGIELEGVLFVNIDDDSPGITVSAPSGTTNENGGTATFTVQLNAEPASNVIITFDSTNDQEGTASPGSLTFGSGDWDTPKTVTMTGVDDDAADGAQTYQVMFDPAVSLDPAYAGITPPPLDVVNADDEVPGILLSAVNELTTESGDDATISVVLQAQPANDVTIQVYVTDRSEATVSTSSLLFTAADWDTPQDVTVSGVNDLLDDGHRAYQLRFAPSGDPTYASLGVIKAFLTNVDDGGTASVLIYDDGFDTFADDAATAVGFSFDVVNDDPAFEAAFDSGAYNIILWERSGNAVLSSGAEMRLLGWISSGGRLIFSDTDLDGLPNVASALGVSTVGPYEGWQNVVSTPSPRANFFQGFTSPLTGVNVTVDNGHELTLTGGGEVFARLLNTTGAGAVVVPTGDHSIVLGFAPDDASGADGDADTIIDVQEMYQNQLVFVAQPPAPFTTIRVDAAGLPIAIPDNPTVFSPLVVTSSGVIARVRVSFHLTHTFDGDLDIFLVGPDGSQMELTTDNGSSGDNFGSGCLDAQRTTFDESAATAITAGTAPFVGTFRPEGSSAEIAGGISNGTWTLSIDDDAGGDVGSLLCWSLFLDVEEL